MKKDVSMTGFAKLCSDLAPVSFLFDSENQNRNNGFKIVATYSQMVYMLCPDKICFKNDGGSDYLCLSDIKRIQYDNQNGDVFRITCGDFPEEDISYTIFADKKSKKHKNLC